MAKFDSDELLQTLKTRGLLPTASTAFATSDFLKMLSDECDLWLAPLMAETRGDHMCFLTTIAVVQGQTAYQMPSRALANGLRWIGLTDANGNYRVLPEIEIAALPTIGAQSTKQGDPRGYYMTGPFINLYPIPVASSQWTLQVYCYYHPSRIVGTTAVMGIGAINTGAKTVTATAIAPSNSVPAAFLQNDADGNAFKYDFVRGKPPFDIIAMDQTLSGNPAGSVVTMSAALPTGLATGDYLTFAGETAIPNFPEIVHPIIATRAVVVALRAKGDRGGAAEMEAEAVKQEARALVTLTPRNRGNARKIVGRQWL